MFLAKLEALIDASSAPDGMTAHELDARAEGELKVCNHFTSVSKLKNIMRSCLRGEAIKSVAAHGNMVCYAHGQANNWLITKRFQDSGLSLKDTQYAHDLSSRFMAEESKPTLIPAKTYLTAAAEPELDIDEKKEQKEHTAMLLSFYETHKTMVIAAAKAAEETMVVDMVTDAAADEAGTAMAMVMSVDKRELCCTHQGCPSPQTHDTSTCEYHAQLVLDRKREREKAACDATFFSALSSDKSVDGSATSEYSCLSDTDSTNSAFLSATPASTDTSAPLPSS